MSKPKPIPARDLPRVAWRRVLREVRTRTAPSRPRAIRVGASVQEIATQIRTRQTPRFFGLIPEQAALLARFYPEVRDNTIEQANKIREHRFDLLGSGEKYLGKELTWHTDFKHGYTWSVKYHARLQLSSPKGGFDVKVPWELSRFHHAIRLGQAYLYTQNEIYAQEIIDQITHWIKSNPYEFGVNWASPMDVAIRAINWIWAYYFIVESGSLNTEFLALWLTSLRQHGEYLLKHLGEGWPHTHRLIASLAGLAYLGIVFPEFPEASRWKSVGLTRLWEELERQVNPDGMDYEASVAYHRFVTEVALSVAGLCVVNRIDMPETALARLRSMLDVIMAYTQPDGLVPQIGDIDGARLHPLSTYPDSMRAIHDHRHLLGLGSLVLERELSEWAGFVEPTRRGWSVAAGGEWQDAFWCFASDAAARLTDVLTRITRRPEGADPDDWVDVRPGVRVQARALARKPVTLSDVTGACGFEASGLYIMRHEDFHLAVDAGGVGQDGAGGHAHNDILSLVLSAYGKTFLIDPGSYLYTSDPEERNSFRSTAYHNTLQIGEEEINRFSNGELFRLTEDARVTVHRWICQESYDLFDASHNGYARIDPGITHQRQIWFDKTARLWILHDQVRLAEIPDKKGQDKENADSKADKSKHETTSIKGGEDGQVEKEKNGQTSEEAGPILAVTLHFHFAPLPVRLDRANNSVNTELPIGPNLIILPMGDFPLKASLQEEWYSPRYGVKEKAPVARFAGQTKLPLDLILLLYPHQSKADLKVVRSAGREALVKMRKALAPATRPGKSSIG